MSRPLRARGLKPSSAANPSSSVSVAPPAGAWIETALEIASSAAASVAPPAGAWIETQQSKYTLQMYSTSRPLRARGLKPAIS